MTKPADLIAYLFEKPRRETTPLSNSLLAWMDSSPAFTGFVDAYRDKIRKKIRVTSEPGPLLDLLNELEIASRLLADRRFALVYEPYASEKRRGADFSVSYRVNTVFNLEAARLREEEPGAALRPAEDRITRVTLGKLSQMQPGMPNLLAIQARADQSQPVDLAALMQGVKLRADARDPAFYAATRYASTADLYKAFNRLNGIFLWSPGEPPGQLWVNRQARPEIDEKVLRLVAGLVSGPG